MINETNLISLSFGKKEDTGGEGVILGDNPAGHSLLFRNLILINFFKYIMIGKLKMRVAGQIFGKIYI